MSTYAVDGWLLILTGTGGRLGQEQLCTHARGGVPPLRRWGALRTEPPLRVSAYAVNDEPRGALFSTVPY